MADERPPKGSLVPVGTRLYRGERTGGGKTAGIHWSLSPQIAKRFARDEGSVHTVEITDPEGQVIPYGRTYSVNWSPDRGPWTVDLDRAQGTPDEQEVRLRPGAKFKTLEGRDIEISGAHREHMTYGNLHQYATTPEIANKEWFHVGSRLGFTQPAIFDSVENLVHPDAPKRYVQSLESRGGDFSENLRKYSDEIYPPGQEDDMYSSSMDVVSPPTHPYSSILPGGKPKPAEVPHVVQTSQQFKNYVEPTLPGI